MGVWSDIIGIRRGLDLRRKWWHQVAIGVAFVSAFVIFINVLSVVARNTVKLTRSNTHSLAMLNYAMGRSGVTTLDDLDVLAGAKAIFMPDGTINIAKRAAPPETIRCETPAKYVADASFVTDGVAYHAIPDRAGQPNSERRYCAATKAYARTTADSVVVLVADNSLVNSQLDRGFFMGIAAVVLWLLVYWTAYYRLLVPIYVRRRDARRRKRRERAYAKYVVQ